MNSKTKSLVYVAAGAALYAFHSATKKVVTLPAETVKPVGAMLKVFGGLLAYNGLKGFGCSPTTSFALVGLGAGAYEYTAHAKTSAAGYFAGTSTDHGCPEGYFWNETLNQCVVNPYYPQPPIAH
jgi:hypothetical protein